MLHDAIAHEVFICIAQKHFGSYTHRRVNRSITANNSAVTRQRGARNVKNLDYKNASSWTVTNSQTFLDLQITRIFMRVRERERSLSNTRHLGNDFVLTEGFSSGRIARGMPAPSFAVRNGISGSFSTGVINVFIRAHKIRVSVSDITCKVSEKLWILILTISLEIRIFFYRKDIVEEYIFNILH